MGSWRLRPERSVERHGQIRVAGALGEFLDAAFELDDALALPEQVFNAREALRVVGKQRRVLRKRGVDAVEALAVVRKRLGNRAHALVEVFEGEGLGHEGEVNE